MSGGERTRSRRALAEFLVAWLSLGLAAAFWIWMLTSSIEELTAPELAAPRLVTLLVPAAVAAGAAAALLHWFGARAALARLCCASGLCYLACLKVAALSAPWIALALALAAAVGMREPPAITSALLLLHSMAGMTGFYLVFSLSRYLSAAGAFADVLRAMRQLLS